MKKLLSMLLIALTLCVPALSEEDWYLATAMDLTEKAGELCQDEVYWETQMGRRFECVDAIQAADFTAVQRIYRAEIYPKTLTMLLKIGSGSKISGAAWEMAEQSMAKMLLTLYNSRQGSDVLAASSILTFEQSYLIPENFIPCMYIVEVDGAVVGMTFFKTGEDTITVTAQPLFCEAGEGAEDVIHALPPVIAFEQVM